MELSQFGAEGTLVLLVIIIGASVYAFVDSSFLSSMMFDIKEIKQHRQYYRFITSGFVHNDFFHMAFNLFSLHSFSQGIENHFGKLALYGIFFTSVIAGSLFSFFKNRKKTEYLALGASGGVVGVIFASIFLFDGMSVMMPFVPFAVPGFVYAIFYILVSHYSMNHGSDNIGHDAHLGGAIMGTIAAILIVPEIVTERYLLLSGVFLPMICIFIYNRFFSRKAKWSKKLN